MDNKQKVVTLSLGQAWRLIDVYFSFLLTGGRCHNLLFKVLFSGLLLFCVSYLKKEDDSIEATSGTRAIQVLYHSGVSHPAFWRGQLPLSQKLIKTYHKAPLPHSPRYQYNCLLGQFALSM